MVYTSSHFQDAFLIFFFSFKLAAFSFSLSLTRLITSVTSPKWSRAWSVGKLPRQINRTTGFDLFYANQTSQSPTVVHFVQEVPASPYYGHMRYFEGFYDKMMFNKLAKLWLLKKLALKTLSFFIFSKSPLDIVTPIKYSPDKTWWPKVNPKPYLKDPNAQHIDNKSKAMHGWKCIHYKVKHALMNRYKVANARKKLNGTSKALALPFK